MGYKVDNRGSKDQRLLYDMLQELYPSLQIIYEYPLYELGQRIDIYIPSLALAFEYMGIQHTQFVPFFHKTLEDYYDQQELDRKKREYLLLRGIKQIDIQYNSMVKNKEELLNIINETPYPDFEFKPLPEQSDSQLSFKNKEKEKRKNDYQKRKSLYQEDSLVRKERLEKERQFRKERYKKMKENK